MYGSKVRFVPSLYVSKHSTCHDNSRDFVDRFIKGVNTKPDYRSLPNCETLLKNSLFNLSFINGSIPYWSCKYSESTFPKYHGLRFKGMQSLRFVINFEIAAIINSPLEKSPKSFLSFTMSLWANFRKLWNYCSLIEAIHEWRLSWNKQTIFGVQFRVANDHMYKYAIPGLAYYYNMIAVFFPRLR